MTPVWFSGKFKAKSAQGASQSVGEIEVFAVAGHFFKVEVSDLYQKSSHGAAFEKAQFELVVAAILQALG